MCVALPQLFLWSLIGETVNQSANLSLLSCQAEFPFLFTLAQYAGQHDNNMLASDGDPWLDSAYMN